jgi:hypothetical protein
VLHLGLLWLALHLAQLLLGLLWVLPWLAKQTGPPLWDWLLVLL